jgi:hypothetical protein
MKKIIIRIAGLAIAGLSVAACGSAHAASPAAAVSTSAPASAPTAAAPKAPASTSAPVTAAPAPAPSTATVTFHGHGNESTPKFSTTGDFTVSWAFKGNADVTQWATGTTTSPHNFSISMFSSGQTEVGQTGQDLNFNDPNEIAASDSGNQTISGDDGTHYFTVSAGSSCTWTFTVTSAS